MDACRLSMWSTPLSGAYSVLMSSLSHEGSLTIIFQAKFERECTLVCFSFSQPHSYKRIPNSVGCKKSTRKFTYRLPKSWRCRISRLVMRLRGQTKIVPEPDGFVFLCDEARIEVLSSAQPSVRILGRQPLR